MLSMSLCPLNMSPKYARYFKLSLELKTDLNFVLTNESLSTIRDDSWPRSMAFYGEGNMNFEQFFVIHLNPKLKNKVSTYFRRQIFHVPDFQTPANTVYTGIQEA